MKKIISIFLSALLLTLCFTACGKKTPEPISEDVAKEKAAAHSQMFIQGKFDEVIADCNDKVKKQITAQALSEAWAQVTAQAGEYESVISTETALKDGTVGVVMTLKFEKVGVALTLNYDVDGKINGLWVKNAPIAAPLEETDLYVESKIEIGEYKLNGVLTTPKNVKDYPVVVFVQGSGASDCDETIGKAMNKPFKQISDALAKQGIATVRFNKRFYQSPQSVSKNPTIYEEYMDDVKWAIDWAVKNVSDDVYVLGHSQGAMSAPKIAADSPQVDGIIMLAGTTRGLEDVILDQNISSIEDMDITDTEKKAYLKNVKDEVEKVKNLKTDDGSTILGINAGYWISLKTLEGEKLLKNIDIPVLILQGEKDFQVSYEKDFMMMKNMLKDNDEITFNSYENLTHLFMPQTLKGDKIDITEYDTKNEIPQVVTDDIGKWILADK